MAKRASLVIRPYHTSYQNFSLPIRQSSYKCCRPRSLIGKPHSPPPFTYSAIFVRFAIFFFHSRLKLPRRSLVFPSHDTATTLYDPSRLAFHCNNHHLPTPLHHCTSFQEITISIQKNPCLFTVILFPFHHFLLGLLRGGSLLSVVA